MLEHADRQPTDKIDEQNHQTSNGIALNKLHRPIHGTVELALALQQRASATGFSGFDVAVSHVVVDAHLLAGHGIKSKTRRHFRYALRALGNHQKLGHRNDQEDHHADDHFAGDNEIAKGGNDLASVTL